MAGLGAFVRKGKSHLARPASSRRYLLAPIRCAPRRCCFALGTCARTPAPCAWMR